MAGLLFQVSAADVNQQCGVLNIPFRGLRAYALADLIIGYLAVEKQLLQLAERVRRKNARFHEIAVNAPINWAWDEKVSPWWAKTA